MALAEIITAGTVMAGTLGGGVAFVWSKVEDRFKRIEQALADCQKRETVAHSRRATHLTVIELLWQELQRLAPDSPTFARSKRLLDDLKAINAEHREP